MDHKPAIQTSESPVGRGGFSLLEMIGVLAVLSILALALVPVLIRHADIAAVNTETATLRSINNALVAHVLRNSSIPSEGAWAAAAANGMALPSASITNNARRYPRAYLVDRSGWLGTTLPTTGYYSQPATGTVITNSARLMIVSSLSADLPVPTGRPSAASFNDIWNTAPKAIPSTWATTWKGRGDDLLIERMNLQPLFSQLILVNHDNGNTAVYVVAGQTNVLAAHSIANAYYMNGTVVGLGSGNWASTVFQTSYVLNGNISYVFEGGIWGGQIANSPNVVSTNSGSALAATFKALEQAFLAAPNSPDNSNPGAAAGDQQQVLAAMSDFMTIYTLWSGENPQFGRHFMSPGQAKNHLSIYNYLRNSQAWLDQAAGTSRNITTAPYYSGLLFSVP